MAAGRSAHGLTRTTPIPIAIGGCSIDGAHRRMFSVVVKASVQQQYSKRRMQTPRCAGAETATTRTAPEGMRAWGWRPMTRGSVSATCFSIRGSSGRASNSSARYTRRYTTSGSLKKTRRFESCPPAGEHAAASGAAPSWRSLVARPSPKTSPSWTANRCGEGPLAIHVGDVIPLPPTCPTCARLNSQERKSG
jgi:hypothetical protein